ncbi:TPA: type I-E CRISPR-associated protein Cas7/Cse4/CasC [Escherichia coli]|nr:type I-E CRISPR-associated protein Cas7/Cse4/CasC [Escherichia coli]
MRKYPLSLLKDKNIVTFFDFWGKTRRGEKDGGNDYHLLCWHSLDVAAMGYLMVKKNCFGLADYFRQLGISDKEQAAQFFAWLLCWHDIGKFARSFQQLYLPPELKIQEGARKNYEKISHSTLGYWLWNHYLSECQELLPSSSLSPRKLRRVIEMWMPVTTGHHGRPPDRMDELDNFLPEDKAAARDFLLEIKPLFPLIEIPAFWDDDEGIELIKHLSWYISATVVLADWTGSSTRFFPRVAHPMDIKGYWQKTLIQAQNALTVFPLKAKVAPFNGINTLFPFIENPTPLQQKVLDLDISQQGPQLFILEDVTGAGKTEAALILAHRLIAAGKAQGLFFGLPTMATANAMYDRLVKTWLAFYSPESRPSLVLAHSARTLMDRFNESLWSGDLVGSEEPDEQTFSQGCAAWFADSNKKALLAEIGVGTLDQAMMAVMPFKHNNLRLLGLSNKILLADEIHACDAYMSCILEGLIERQARGGNSVILLSATLSQQQRDKLVAAFARGTEGQQEAPFLEKDDYPWLTHVTKAACQVAHAFGVSETIVEDDFFTAVDDLRQASEDAGAGHLGETGFGSALFYTYICIDKDLLVENLGGDEALANQTIRAFTEAALKVSPTGKQNSFASRAYASWALAEKGTDQPRSLAAAFYEPINGTRQLDVAVQRITTLRENMNTVYEQKTECASFDVMNKQGSMKDVLDFICA